MFTSPHGTSPVSPPPPPRFSAYDIVNAEKLVIDQKALAIIEEEFA